VAKKRESEASEVVVAMVAQVTVERDLENEAPDWERRIQIRLMDWTWIRAMTLTEDRARRRSLDTAALKKIPHSNTGSCKRVE